MSNENYWDERYLNEGLVWGEAPSRTAIYALELFRKHPVKKILVPGSGYGRNTKLFSTAGFDVTGMDNSTVACELARKYDPATTFFNKSVLDMPLNNKYDAIFCFNLLHLFYKEERASFLKQCSNVLQNNGLMFFVVFSEKEAGFGKGNKVEENTFESRPGRPAHYFTKEDLTAHFENFIILESGLMDDPENHSEGPHTHILRYIFVQKPAMSDRSN